MPKNILANIFKKLGCIIDIGVSVAQTNLFPTCHSICHFLCFQYVYVKVTPPFKDDRHLMEMHLSQRKQVNAF